MVISAPTLSGVQRTRTVRAERLYVFDIYKSKHIVFMYLSSCASREVQRSQVSIWDVKPVRAPGRYGGGDYARDEAPANFCISPMCSCHVWVCTGARTKQPYIAFVSAQCCWEQNQHWKRVWIFLSGYMYICEKLVSREITDNDVHRAREPIILGILLLRYLCCLLGDTLTSCGRLKLI